MTFYESRLKADRDRDAPVKTPTQARQGVTGHNVRYVLAASLTARRPVVRRARERAPVRRLRIR